MAAGLIAFGAGWLASSLLPSTQKEQQAATAVEERVSEHSYTLTQPLKEAAGQAKENLAAPAQEAVQSVKDTAMDAVGTVKDEAQNAQGEVAGSTEQATDEVRQSHSY